MSSFKDVVSPSTVTTSVESFTGRVKWFNNKAGYGFITITDGARSGTDVFVHHSAISVANEQYKYLVQGEYVEFELSDVKTGSHEFQAANVGGIKSGQLMCETRHEFKLSRTAHKSSVAVSTTEAPVVQQTQSQDNAKTPRQRSAPSKQYKSRGEGPRSDANNGPAWTLVGKDSEGKAPRKPRAKQPPRQKVESN
jgi:CspA family cold shock protein